MVFLGVLGFCTLQPRFSAAPIRYSFVEMGWLRSGSPRGPRVSHERLVLLLWARSELCVRQRVQGARGARGRTRRNIVNVSIDREEVYTLYRNLYDCKRYKSYIYIVYTP